MESVKFQALLRAVECGSLTKAADELGYTQAGLTHMMNRLEKEIGVTLLCRTKSGVQLTSDGERLLPVMKSFAREGAALQQSINDLKSNNDSVIRIASYPSVARTILPDVIRVFKKDNPEIQVELQTGSFERICGLVTENSVDMGLISKTGDLKGDWLFLKKDPFCLIKPENTDTDGLPMLRPFKYITADLPENIFSCSENELDSGTLLAMIGQGLGYTVLPELVVQGHTGFFDIEPYEPQVFRELGIFVRSKKMLSPSVRKFISVCRMHIK